MKNPISARKVTPMIADMRGREFITLIGCSAAAWRWRAQQRMKQGHLVLSVPCMSWLFQ